MTTLPSLFERQRELLSLLEMNEGELFLSLEEDLRETNEAIQEKIDRYIWVIDHIPDYVDQLRTEAKQLYDFANRCEDRRKYLFEYLRLNLGDKIQGSEFQMTTRKAQPSFHLKDHVDQMDLREKCPEIFQTSYTLSKTLLKEYWEKLSKKVQECFEERTTLFPSIKRVMKLEDK